jgi:hypothetical protein
MNHIYQGEQFGQDWFTYPKLYSEMARKFPSGSKFVEVGVWKGKSAAYMAVEIANSGKNIDFYCVDHWLGSIEHYDRSTHMYEPNISKLYETFISNMEPVKDYYTTLRMSSKEAATKFEDGSLDFVFVDAAHQYEDVCEDIDTWRPKVKSGGVLAGHDYQEAFPGVIKAVNEKIDGFYVAESCWVHQVK